MEEDGIESNFPADFRTRETADLLLVLTMHRLEPGGRAAEVLPCFTLFGEGIKTHIKESLLTTCNLHTAMYMPNGVFAPCTGIKIDLLFVTKGAQRQPRHRATSPELASHDPGELLAAADLQGRIQSTRDQLKAVRTAALASSNDSQ